MTKPDFERLFGELEDEMKFSGARAEVYVFGGAAMAMGYNDQRATKDVDAIITSRKRNLMLKAVAKIGRKHGIGEDWLNEAGTSAVPRRKDLGQKTVYAGSNLTVRIAGRRHLSAMKLEAGRPVDKDDLAVLVGTFGPDSAEEMVELHHEAYEGRSEKNEQQLLDTGRDVYEAIEDRKAEGRRRSPTETPEETPVRGVETKDRGMAAGRKLGKRSGR